MAGKKKINRKIVIFAVVFLTVNIAGIFAIGRRESAIIRNILSTDADKTKTRFQEVLENYTHSFQLFAKMMEQEIRNNPNPDDIWDYLKGVDTEMLDIEGETFDGLYMYYQGRYLYSWDTPYSEYEDTGYDATQRPWYRGAVEGNGEIVFTPPYMSYANNYILTTISQLQPDGKTVFAYDIKMGDIQKLVSTLGQYEDEQIMFFDKAGTMIGSTDTKFLGSDINDPSSAFYEFRKTFDDDMNTVLKKSEEAVLLSSDGRQLYGYLLEGEGYNFLILVPFASILKTTMAEWLVPFLLMELLLVYILGSISREQKNRELKSAYIELGQTQRRLEIALNMAQKAAVVDELTGLMNMKSFKSDVTNALASMGKDESGILIMIDGDHFKSINDNYGHSVGDEVIKLTAHMIIGRIRTVDFASRLHGDEYAVFIANTDDYNVAENIMKDINQSIEKEAKRRNMPFITVSSGAVIAKHGDNYSELSKAADEALYRAKETHDGKFSR